MQNKDILLISYVFPPYPGIGGRRWAKHAIALTRLGYKVHVICAKNPFDTVSLWWEEIKKEKNIVLHVIPASYPKAILNYNTDLISRLKYKVWLFFLCAYCKGSIYDRSAFWERALYNKATDIISKHKIDRVIVTGGPFRAMYYATKLKKIFGNIFLINDMRDPWTWAPNWGYRGLEKERMKFEKKWEHSTIQGSDIITVPTGEMMEHLIREYPQFKKKIKVLPHFFDADELCMTAKNNSQKIRLVYYGTLYQDIGNLMQSMSSFLKKNADKFSFDIYSDTRSYSDVFGDVPNVKFKSTLQLKKLYEKFSDYDYVFIPTPDYGKNNISTKFFEIIYSKTPLIIYSEAGKAGEFVEKNGVGLWIGPDQLEDKLMALYEKRQFVFNNEFDVSPYALSNVAKQIDELLNLKQNKNVEH